ncbi:MAG TPA: MgtC/SapB family protein [Candidatus Eisenbacteria bacterium]|nr:MgtC/SapB family protein [Candidatus Eisenbacteria bacterium]
MNWLIGDWHTVLGPPWAEILLALIAVICGSIVGAEREKKEKPAGLRTLTLVSLGSAVFTMASVSFGQGDPSRVAAQVVTGIGFLGAGAILRGSAGVTGMTTAATIWVMAATGMVVGMGFAVAGLALSLLVLGVLTVISSLESKYLASCELNSVVVTFDPAGGKAIVKIDEILEDYHLKPTPLDLATTPEGLKQLRVTYCHAHRHHRELLTHLAALPEIREIRRDDSNAGQ